MATGIMKPNELTSFIGSYDVVCELYNLVEDYKLLSQDDITPIAEFIEIVNNLKSTFLMEYCSLYWCNIEHNIFTKGYDTKADELQSNVDLNENILNLIIDELSNYLQKRQMEDKINIDKFKFEIKTLGKYGKHIYINTELYNFLTTNNKITGNDKLVIKAGNGERYIEFKQLNYTFHKKFLLYFKM